MQRRAAHPCKTRPERFCTRSAMNLRFPRRWRLWRSWPYWRSRAVFWTGGAFVGIIAALFAMLADEAQALFGHVLASSPYWPMVIVPAGFALSAATAKRFFPG